MGSTHNLFVMTYFYKPLKMISIEQLRAMLKGAEL